EQIVGEGGAKLVERLGYLGFSFSSEVAPHFAVIGLDLAEDRAIGIDLVTGMNEEIGRVAAHRLVEPIAAPFGVDAPALPRLVTRKGEGDGPLVAARHAQHPCGRRAQRLWIGKILETHAIKYLTARWKRP